MTNQALSRLGLSSDGVRDVWRVVAAALYFGQLDICSSGNDQAAIREDMALQRLAALLGVSESNLCSALTNPRLEAVRSETVQAQTAAQVYYFALSLSLYIYISSPFCFLQTFFLNRLESIYCQRSSLFRYLLFCRCVHHVKVWPRHYTSSSFSTS